VAQAQEKPVAELVQTPAFIQGDEAQLSNVVWQRVPKKPVVQAQEKPVAELLQTPPLAQGLELQES